MRLTRVVNAARLAKLGRFIAIFCAVGGLGLCALALMRAWPSTSASLRGADRVWLGIGAACTVAVVNCWSVVWFSTLRSLGEVRRVGEVATWFFAGELAKYIPGGVWSLIGRGEIARRAGVPRVVSYQSVAISLATTAAGALVLFLSLLPLVTVNSALGYLPLIAAALLLGTFVVPGVRRRLSRLMTVLPPSGAAVEHIDSSRTLILVLTALPSWILYGAASTSFATALGYPHDPVQVAFAAVSAWLVGFLAIPVPAGVGIREATFLVLSGMDAGGSVAVAAMSRLGLMLVDGAGGAVALLLTHNLLRSSHD